MRLFGDARRFCHRQKWGRLKNDKDDDKDDDDDDDDDYDDNNDANDDDANDGDDVGASTMHGCDLRLTR